MNAHGLRVRLATNPETGLPYSPVSAPGLKGAVRFWRWIDRSRQSLPDTHELEFTIPLRMIPTTRAEEALELPGAQAGVLQVDPRRDVWTAPECVQWIDLVSCPEPEQLQSVNPRPDDWRPE